MKSVYKPNHIIFGSFLLGFIVFLATTSCQNKEASEELRWQAQQLYYSDELERETRADSALVLTNLALEEYDENISALEFKASLVFRTKDSLELIGVLDKLIEIRPDKPFFLGHKAMYLLFMGEENESLELLKRSFKMYEGYLQQDSTDIQLYYEYMNTLIYVGDTSRIFSIIHKRPDVDVT